MIRYKSDGPGRFQVFARRKLKGHVYEVSEAVEVRKISQFEASVTWEMRRGWKAVGLNGYNSGRLYSSRKEAARRMCEIWHYRANPPPSWDL